MKRRGFLGALLGIPAAVKALAETPAAPPPAPIERTVLERDYIAPYITDKMK